MITIATLTDLAYNYFKAQIGFSTITIGTLSEEDPFMIKLL